LPELGHERVQALISIRDPGLTMCIASPARVVERDGATAVVQLAGHARRASLLLAPDVKVGAWVLVAAGTVVREIDAAEAADLAAQLEAAVSAASPPPAPTTIASTAPGGST